MQSCHYRAFSFAATDFSISRSHSHNILRSSFACYLVSSNLSSFRMLVGSYFSATRLSLLSLPPLNFLQCFVTIPRHTFFINVYYGPGARVGTAAVLLVLLLHHHPFARLPLCSERSIAARPYVTRLRRGLRRSISLHSHNHHHDQHHTHRLDLAPFSGSRKIHILLARIDAPCRNHDHHHRHEHDHPPHHDFISGSRICSGCSVLARIHVLCRIVHRRTQH